MDFWNDPLTITRMLLSPPAELDSFGAILNWYSVVIPNKFGTCFRAMLATLYKHLSYKLENSNFLCLFLLRLRCAGIHTQQALATPPPAGQNSIGD